MFCSIAVFSEACLFFASGFFCFYFAVQGKVPNLLFYVPDACLTLVFGGVNAYFPMKQEQGLFWFRDLIVYCFALAAVWGHIFLAALTYRYFSLGVSNESRLIYALIFPLASDSLNLFV